MIKIIPALFLALLVSGSTAPERLKEPEKMTPERFKAIVAMPGDNVPLATQFFHARPFWPNAKWSATGTDDKGKTVQNEGTTTARTIQGKYIVSTSRSKLEPDPSITVTTLGGEPGTFRIFWLDVSENRIVEADIVDDWKRKTFTGATDFGAGIKMIASGWYSDKECYQKISTYDHDVVMSTREFMITPDTSADKK